jgi:hypothetical protein
MVPETSDCGIEACESSNGTINTKTETWDFHFLLFFFVVYKLLLLISAGWSDFSSGFFREVLRQLVSRWIWSLLGFATSGKQAQTLVEYGLGWVRNQQGISFVLPVSPRATGRDFKSLEDL